MYISPNVNLASVASATDMTTLLARLTAVRATNLDNLDELVSLTEQRKLVAGGPGHITIPDGAAAPGVTGGAANTYGAWAQLVAATASDMILDGLFIWNQNAGVGSTYGQLQIGVGAGGAEVVQDTLIMPMLGNLSYAWGYVPILVPLPVANGVRVAARLRTNSAGEVYRVYAHGVAKANTQKWSA